MKTEILVGDVIEQLRTLPDESVHCVVTSPPYWGLRDYGTPGQLGLEPTPEAHVAKMVEVFREVRRVLRSDGTLWLNYGDSYAASGPPGGKGKQDTNAGSFGTMQRAAPPGLKPKDLVGMPWRVAFGLQADGWYLRSDIVWAKPNPMPESVTDRPTKSHEYIFLLTKSPRYFFDQEAVREKATGFVSRPSFRGGCYVNNTPGKSTDIGNVTSEQTGRNIRTVWSIPTQPFPQAHFATFPEEIPYRCIKAGTSLKGCCPDCGAPWGRVVEKPKVGDWSNRQKAAEGIQNQRASGEGVVRIGGSPYREGYGPPKTTGWEPACTCKKTPTPCTVLDPFMGSGTTLLVAQRLGRSAIGIELNPEYANMAQERLHENIPLFS